LIVGGFYSEYCSPGGLASSRVRTSGGYHVWEEEDEGVVVVVAALVVEKEVMLGCARLVVAFC